MNTTKLPPDLPKSRTARVLRPDRSQYEWTDVCLDEMLDQNDKARLVWKFVCSIDINDFYEGVEVSESSAGRPAIAPELLLALWILATLDGIGSAREIARRCENHTPYRWLCGHVNVNYHTLSDFRGKHTQALDKLLVNSVASMVDKGLVPLKTLAQDGMRVRASAGKSSFRRQPKLEELQELATAHLNRLKEEAEDEGKRQESLTRSEAAQKRAANEKAERLAEAIRQVEELAKQKEKRQAGTGQLARVSTTDPDARNMKMANGGFNPALNVQFASDGDARVIVAVEITNEGTDSGQMPPMVEKVERDYGKTPAIMMVDSAFATKDSVTKVEQKKVQVVSSVPRADQLKKSGKDPHTQQKGDTKEFVDFRKRMGLPENQILYQKRPSIAEFPNAVCRNQNLQQFNVRGMIKALAVALLHALAFNFRRMIDLGFLG